MSTAATAVVDVTGIFSDSASVADTNVLGLTNAVHHTRHPYRPIHGMAGCPEAATSGGNPGTDNPAVQLLEFFVAPQKNADTQDNNAEALLGLLWPRPSLGPLRRH